MALRYTLVQADMIRLLTAELNPLNQRVAAKAPASIERKGHSDYPMLRIPDSASEEEKLEMQGQLRALYGECTRELLGELGDEDARSCEARLFGKLMDYAAAFDRLQGLLDSSSPGFRDTLEQQTMWAWMDVCEANAFYRRLCSSLNGITPRPAPTAFPKSLRPRAAIWFAARKLSFPTL